MLTTFGLILVIKGSFVAFRHSPTTWLSSFKSVPNCAPPALMLGQETFNSSAPTPPRASNRRATSAYSSTVVPQMLIIVGTFSPFRNGQYFRMKPSTPGPWRPMALIRPLVTSTVRGVELPRTVSFRSGHLQPFQERPVFPDETVHARSLEANGVDQAAGNLDRARSRVAANGFEPDALDDDRAELVEINELGIFDAVAEGARGHGHRVLQGQRADLDGQVHSAASQAICRKSKTGPSVQVRWYSQLSPALMGTTQVRQTPMPQPMCSSSESSAGRLNSAASRPTAFNIGVGPQAKSLRPGVRCLSSVSNA